MRQILKIKLRLAPSRHIDEAQVSATQKNRTRHLDRDQYQIVADMYLDLCAQQLVDIQKLIVLASVHESPGAEFFRRTKHSFSPQRMLVLWATNEFTAYGKIKRGKLDQQKIDDHFWSLIVNKITTRSLKLEEQNAAETNLLLREYIAYIHLKALYRNILVIYEEMMAMPSGNTPPDCLDVPDEVTNKCIKLYNKIRFDFTSSAEAETSSQEGGGDGEFRSMVAQNQAHSTRLSSVLNEEKNKFIPAASIISDTARILIKAQDACTSLECVYREILAAQKNATSGAHETVAVCANLGMLDMYGKYTTKERSQSLVSFSRSHIELQKLNLRNFSTLRAWFTEISKKCASVAKISIHQKEEIALKIDAFVDSYTKMQSDLNSMIQNLVDRLNEYNNPLRNTGRSIMRPITGITTDPRELINALETARDSNGYKDIHDAVKAAYAWLGKSKDQSSSEDQSSSDSDTDDRNSGSEWQQSAPEPESDDEIFKSALLDAEHTDKASTLVHKFSPKK
jgi:hypothetical protein